MTATLGDLPDVNVWLALASPGHAHHPAALSYWQQPTLPKLWFNRITMLGLVRLLSQKAVMGTAVLSTARAAEVYEYFAGLAEVGFMPEPSACGAGLQQVLAAGGVTPAMVTDVYLACFAKSGGLRLVTFDKDFERIAPSLPLLRLVAPAH
jgi:toxin-antitoxin system PIN domain toxin